MTVSSATMDDAAIVVADKAASLST